MTSKIKVVHYINQFFAGIGGEEQAGTPLQAKPGPAGPGKGLQDASAGKVEVIQTLICGDNYFQEHSEDVLKEIVQKVQEISPDLLLAGPAFNAGRYGLACRAVCERIQKDLGIPTLTAMYRENPAAIETPIRTYILSCGDSARDMKTVLPSLADFAYRLATGAEIRDAEAEGYLPRGARRNVFQKQTGARRAVEMLKAKLKGSPLTSEIPLPALDKVVPPPPLKDLSKATIVLATDGGVVPKGNPDHLETARATKWFQYDIAEKNTLTPEEYESIHGGFDLRAVNEDPNRVVPLDGMRELEREGKIKKLYDSFYTTSGMTVPIVNAIRIGKEMAASIASTGANGVILTGT